MKRWGLLRKDKRVGHDEANRQLSEEADATGEPQPRTTKLPVPVAETGSNLSGATGYGVVSTVTRPPLAVPSTETEARLPLAVPVPDTAMSLPALPVPETAVAVSLGQQQ